MNEDVKGANAVQKWQKSDTGRDLPNDFTYFLLDFLLIFVIFVASFGQISRRVAILLVGLYIIIFNVELPSLQGLLGLNTCQDKYQLLHFAIFQPFLNTSKWELLSFTLDYLATFPLMEKHKLKIAT